MYNVHVCMYFVLPHHWLYTVILTMYLSPKAVSHPQCTGTVTYSMEEASLPVSLPLSLPVSSFPVSLSVSLLVSFPVVKGCGCELVR